ncbi:unnamed protein product [Vicia faba]|uniref:Uncharacterized protein n=1 Tax=Vicia faba TaxID=3906 RepID=A0AAV0ZZ24_VICFA|nr:unnamed protein product [Vicia faba]
MCRAGFGGFDSFSVLASVFFFVDTVLVLADAALVSVLTDVVLVIVLTDAVLVMVSVFGLMQFFCLLVLTDAVYSWSVEGRLRLWCLQGFESCELSRGLASSLR